MNYPAGLDTGQLAHSRAQFIYAVSGVMRIDTPEAAYVVPPSTALFVPAGATHSVRMDGPVAMRALFLREDATTRAGTGTAVIVVSPLLRELILAACAQPLDWALAERGHHLTELALDEIGRATALPLRLVMPRDERLVRVVVTLRASPATVRGLEDLAGEVGASTRTLARLFQTETGMSFRQWRQQVRMTEALSALSTGATPARTAAAVGYRSLPAFAAALRVLFGITPGQARPPSKVEQSVLVPLCQTTDTNSRLLLQTEP